MSLAGTLLGLINILGPRAARTRSAGDSWYRTRAAVAACAFFWAGGYRT